MFKLDEETEHRIKDSIRRSVEEKKKRWREEFEKAFEQREIQFALIVKKRQTGKSIGGRALTLEEYGRLWVINLGSWLAFTFWRDVRAKHGRKEEKENGTQRKDAA